MAETYSYTPTQWNTGDPITQEKMNKIEAGIADAHSAATTNSQSIGNVETTVNSMNTSISNNSSAIRNLQVEVSTIGQNSEQGVKAWTQVREAIVMSGDTVTKSLNRRISDAETDISNIGLEIRETHRPNVANDRLNTRFEDIDNRISGFNTAMNLINETFTEASSSSTFSMEYGSVDDRIEADEGRIKAIQTILDEARQSTAFDRIKVSAVLDNSYASLDARLEDGESRIVAMQTELANARESTALGKTGNNKYGSIDERFEAIEGELVGQTAMGTRLDTIEGDINSLSNGKVNKADIANNLTTEVAGKVLDATQGKALKDALDAMDIAYQAADTALDNRLDEIEAARPSTVDELTGETVYGTLDDRFDAVEDRATTLETNVYTIATELAMLDNEDAIKTTNTKIDDLEADVQALATEISMGYDEFGRLTGAETRIDDIETEITAAHRTGLVDANEDPIEDTLDNRFDDIEARATTLEGTVNHATTGLAATKVIAEQALSRANDAQATANAAATQTDFTALAGRVTNLENEPKSATVIISKSNIIYDSYGNPTNIGETPTQDKDYLLQNNVDDKYYYWKYIGESPTGTWELISGASGGGGTSSAAFAETLGAIVNPNVNTDYFVGNNTNGYVHYRYIDESGTLTPVIIGADFEKIKRYNIGKIIRGEGTEEETNYLRLFEYPYEALDTDIESEIEDLENWVASTSYSADDKVIYGGYAYNCLTPNSDAEWTASKWELISDIRIVNTIELPKGGGGGSSYSVFKLLRVTPQNIETIKNDDKIKIRAFYMAYDEEEPNGIDGQCVLTTGRTTIFNDTVHSAAPDADPTDWQVNTNGYLEFDVTDYCKIGSTTFTLTITVNGQTRSKSWNVKIYDLRIESDAPNTLLINSASSYGFNYTPFGALSTTLHVLVDNVQIGTKSLSAAMSGRQDTYTIPAQTHGVHKIEMYLSATIDNETKNTTRISRDYIWYNPADTETPIIIASPYRGQTVDVQQYSTLSIPYQVYQKDTDVITVKYYLDNVLYDEVHLDRVNEGIFNYVVTADEGPHTIKIMVEEEYIQIALNVSEMTDVNISPIDNAIIDFDPSTSSNSSINRLPSWTVGQNTYSFSASPNFNWSDDINGGGYKEDENHEKCFIIKAGSYIDLNYPMFANNVFSNGAEMKISFKTAAVRNAEAIWYQNIGEISGKTVGIQLNAHNGWLKTDKAVSSTTLADEDSDEDTITVKGVTYTYWKTNTAYNVNDIRVIRNTIYRCISAVDAFATDLQDKNVDLDEDPAKSYLKKWLKIGQLDTEVLATNSYLYFPYSEEDKIELDININKSAANNNFIMSYEDGVPSKAYAYTTGAGGDKLTHSGTIRIGSDDCDVYIYRLRYYAGALTTAEILQNFIADGATIDEKIDRYNRNCIYWDSTQERYFTSPSQTASLDPIKLAERMPDVKILMLETPTFTTGKKDFVQGASLRCLHVKGGKIYESRGDADNWFFQKGFHAGQGTTSDNYGQAGRNVDFLFEVDGTNYPTKAKNMNGYTPSQDYVSNVVIGEEASEWVETTPNSGVYHWVATRQPETNEVCDDWKGDKCKISLTESSVPNNYFNLKVNIASSENVNNALFQKRYDDFLTYQSPAQAAQIAKHGAAYRAMGLDTDKTKVKNCMEFVPAVLFVRETGVGLDGITPVARNEFNDDKWHFYALGNIGDSKKTDYTRAYDPDDMNEFTCENSDNNTNNGQFQSGVFVYNNHNAIETDYAAWSETTAYKANDIVVYNGTVYTRTGADQATLGENETYSWVTADWTAITYTGWTDQDPPYFAPRTNPNPMEYIYPITPSQWNVKLGDDYLNRKHMTLVTEKFDGDHSFEFRYGCKGDYRDGDLINDTNGNSTIPDGKGGYRTNDEVQFDINHDVMLAMYEWLITATPEQYENEASQWFVKSAMEFFYAYTHYYTMMDNRAKNTFWHFAKTGVYRPVSRPVEALYHIYEIADGAVTVSNGIATGNFKKPEGNFDSNGTYYTQYAFDLWVYDCDTAAGIDNNGALVFPYGKEDEDYRVDGEPSSGYAFNGAGSIFWRRLKTTFADEIASIMDQADKKCFNSEDLIEEFDNFQSCFPEEIWRLDIERKYIRTYTGASIDSSITEGKQNARFLMSMMQGRKKYQRRQWIRDQGFYFNSKYNIGDISTNRTEFNIVSPAGDHSLLAVQPDYHLRLTPYQDMYLNVVVGNGTPIPPIRAKANQEYTIKLDDYAAGNFAETRVYIGGFKMISKLGGLAPMYPYSFTLNGLDHLKELDIGTNNSGYRNGNFTELPLTNEINLPLLETLNIKNCNALATSIGLRTANNLRTVEAIGSSIGGITLPEYTQIETLHLPSTVTDIVLHGARFLKDFIVADRNGVENYSNIYTLDINDSDYSVNFKENPSDPLPVDWLSIAAAVLEKESAQTYVSLTELYSATIGDIQELEPFAQAKSVIEAAGGLVDLTGLIHVTGVWSEVEKESYAGLTTSIWPDLTLNCTGIQQTKWPVVYQQASYVLDDGTVVPTHDYKTIYITEGAIAPDIYYTGDIEKPTRPNTVRYSYSFGEYDGGDYIPYSGWKLSGSSAHLTSAPVITEPTYLQAWFATSTRTYPIKWYLNSNKTGLIKTSEPVGYEAGANQEAPTVLDIHRLGYSTATVSIDNTNNTATYSIFKGWQELPNKIQPLATDDSFNIFADWETATVSLGDMFNTNNITDLTPEQLLVLSAMNDEQKKRFDIYNKIQSGITKINYTLGQDSIKTGTLLVGNTTTPIYRADRNRLAIGDGLVTNVQPFNATNDAFTIAIDYSFNPDFEYNSGATVGILASCYERDVSADTAGGFILYYNLNSQGGSMGPRIAFGNIFKNDLETQNQSVAIGNTTTAKYRNIVVLRHPAGSNTLYIYSGMSAENSLPQEITINNKTWNNFNSDMYLRFGCLTDQNTLYNDANYSGLRTTVDYGGGTIYWAKYWNEDLGLGECKKLAMWPHEKMTYLLTHLDTAATQNARANASQNPIPSIYLTSLTASIHGQVGQTATNTLSSLSWNDSSVRTIMNNRVYLGLPQKLQSILCKSAVSSREMTRDNTTNQYSFNSNPVTTRDYIYAPSACNVTLSELSNQPGYAYGGRAQGTTSEEIEALKPFSHIDTTNVQVYQYNSSNQNWDEYNPDHYYEYLNLRFASKPIDWSNKLRIFIDSNRELTSVSNAIATLRTGDVFINGGNSTGDAYMYISNDDRQNLGIYVSLASKFQDANGGWTPAYPYWLRSVAKADTNARSGYLSILSSGYMTSEASRSNSANLSYSMAI